MTKPEPNSRLYRFTGALDEVVAYGNAGAFRMKPMKHCFRVAKVGLGHDGSTAVFGEFVGGAHCGIGFVLPDGTDNPGVWPQFVEDVP